MAEIVLVHGIAQEQQGSASLENTWTPALADGVQAAGHNKLAERIRSVEIPEGISVRMAFYGNLFLEDGAQGEADTLKGLDPEQQKLAASLAAEWLNHAAERPNHPDHKTAQQQLSQLNDSGSPMGAREEAARVLINGVAQLSWFAPAAMATAEFFVNKSLRQVTRYLTEHSLHDKIQGRVLDLIGPDTKVIVGHSLGSVIAYEIAALHLKDPLPLLLTIGSPLGLRTIIYDRLRPQPPRYPSLVRRWVNIADRNDLVAAAPDLVPLFGSDKPVDAVLESAWTVDNGAKPHDGTFYLRKRESGRPIAAALGD